MKITNVVHYLHETPSNSAVIFNTEPHKSEANSPLDIIERILYTRAYVKLIFFFFFNSIKVNIFQIWIFIFIYTVWPLKINRQQIDNQSTLSFPFSPFALPSRSHPLQPILNCKLELGYHMRLCFNYSSPFPRVQCRAGGSDSHKPAEKNEQKIVLRDRWPSTECLSRIPIFFDLSHTKASRAHTTAGPSVSHSLATDFSVPFFGP